MEDEAMAQDALDRVLAEEAKKEAREAAVQDVLDGSSTASLEEEDGGSVSEEDVAVVFPLEEERFVINEGEEEFTPGDIEEFVLSEEDYQPEDDYDFQPLEA